jgi:hypothetical protein
MNIIEYILTKINGKKSTIVALLALTISFAQSQSWITNDWGVYLNSFLVILAGGANVVNASLLGKDNIKKFFIDVE